MKRFISLPPFLPVDALLHLCRCGRTGAFLLLHCSVVLLAAGLLAPVAAGQSRWKDITPPYYTDNERSYQSVHFTDELNGYAVGRPGRIIKTTDGGQTWTMKSLYPGTLYSIHFPTPTTGYAVGEGGGIFKTTDAGGTWQAQTLNTDVFNYNNYNYNAVHFVDANVGYIVAGRFETGSLVLKTTNGEPVGGACRIRSAVRRTSSSSRGISSMLPLGT
jgi:hypothetical protein